MKRADTSLKDWKTPSGVLKRIYCLYKNLILQVDPKAPQKKIKTSCTLKGQLFGECSCSESHPCKCKFLQLLF